MSSKEMSKKELRAPSIMSKIEGMNAGEELVLKRDECNLRTVRSTASFAQRINKCKYTVIATKETVTVVRLA